LDRGRSGRYVIVIGESEVTRDGLWSSGRSGTVLFLTNLVEGGDRAENCCLFRSLRSKDGSSRLNVSFPFISSEPMEVSASRCSLCRGDIGSDLAADFVFLSDFCDFCDFNNFCDFDGFCRFAISLDLRKFRRSARGDLDRFAARSGLEERLALDLDVDDDEEEEGEEGDDGDERFEFGIREGIDPREDLPDFVVSAEDRDAADVLEAEDFADNLGFDFRRDDDELVELRPPLVSAERDLEDLEDLESLDALNSLDLDFRREELLVSAVERGLDDLEIDFLFFNAFGLALDLSVSFGTDLRFFLALSLLDLLLFASSCKRFEPLRALSDVCSIFDSLNVTLPFRLFFGRVLDRGWWGGNGNAVSFFPLIAVRLADTAASLVLFGCSFCRLFRISWFFGDHMDVIRFFVRKIQ